ncbi:sodium- and chloride-dependent glycine transporter 2-like isoform X2 [Ornithodoros turicata]|uniref:sodium- and chloride-dependent glycine transporter 2-like isoform X2 n=1 Tax=Ornithodoros turicata TaxID=34597 RepID=UPI0031392CD1
MKTSVRTRDHLCPNTEVLSRAASSGPTEPSSLSLALVSLLDSEASGDFHTWSSTTEEVALGQFSGLGAVGIWKCVPIGKGIGVCMCYAAIIVSLYYNVFLAYLIIYIYESMSNDLPWSSCDQEWGADDDCYVRKRGTLLCKNINWKLSQMFAGKNITNGYTIDDGDGIVTVPKDVYENYSSRCTPGRHTAAEEFFFLRVLGLSEGLDTAGRFRTDLTIGLAMTWTIAFVFLAKGVAFTRKLHYLTSTAPYCILFILLLRGVTLPGATQGITYLFVPKNWGKLLDLNVWYGAVQNMIVSLGISTGVIINLGSFNKFGTRFAFGVIPLTVMDILTGLMSGTVVFSVLGNLAYKVDMPVEEVATRTGVSLFFLAYTEAIAELDYAPLWSISFFTAFFLVGMDTNYLMLESVLTTVSDEFPFLRNKRPPTAFVGSIIGFLCSLPMTMQNGFYIPYILDIYIYGVLVPVMAFIEVSCIVMVYGMNRFRLDWAFMMGADVNFAEDICLRLLTPTVIGLSILYGSFLQSGPIILESYIYPSWAKLIGWSIVTIGALQIPMFAYSALYTKKFDIKAATKPTSIWGPEDPETYSRYLKMLRKRRILPRATKRQAEAPPQLSASELEEMSKLLGRTPEDLQKLRMYRHLKLASLSKADARPASMLPQALNTRRMSGRRRSSAILLEYDMPTGGRRQSSVYVLPQYAEPPTAAEPDQARIPRSVAVAMLEPVTPLDQNEDEVRFRGPEARPILKRRESLNRQYAYD